MTRSRPFLIDAASAGKRLDQAIAAALPGVSRSEARRLIDLGAVYVDRRRHKRASTVVEAGQEVEVYAAPAAPLPPASQAAPAGPGAQSDAAATARQTAAAGPHASASRPASTLDRPLSVLFSDEDLIVVEKPAGVASQARRGGDAGTLPWLVTRLLRAQGAYRPYVAVVHRLDQPASGLILLARSRRAAAQLSADFREHAPMRIYLAVTHPAPTVDQTRVTLALDTSRATVRVDATHGKPACTHLRVLERVGPLGLVRAELETGRTHQVRVHLAALGCPIIGDHRYGGGTPTGFEAPGEAPRLGLHAAALSFTHPATGAPMSFECPLPPELRDLLERAR